jgi:hypothetical protein
LLNKLSLIAVLCGLGSDHLINGSASLSVQAISVNEEPTADKSKFKDSQAYPINN